MRWHVFNPADWSITVPTSQLLHRLRQGCLDRAGSDRRQWHKPAVRRLCKKTKGPLQLHPPITQYSIPHIVIDRRIGCERLIAAPPRSVQCCRHTWEVLQCEPIQRDRSPLTSYCLGKVRKAGEHNHVRLKSSDEARMRNHLITDVRLIEQGHHPIGMTLDLLWNFLSHKRAFRVPPQ